MHEFIQIRNLSVSFESKICFENFSTQFHYGSRIAIIGQNGAGKSSLLKTIAGKMDSSAVKLPPDVRIGYLPQIVEEYESLSGGQRINKSLSSVLSLQPNLLLFDEPTNHLDINNRTSFLRMLKSFPGTIIAVSHDEDFLKQFSQIIWHIEHDQVTVFKGDYLSYISHREKKISVLENEIARLEKERKETHLALMKEQERARKRKSYGEKKFDGDKISLSNAKRTGEKTNGKNLKYIDEKKDYLNEKLHELKRPQITVPRFGISDSQTQNKILVSISNGKISYNEKHVVVSGIYLNVFASERVAIIGENGSGKSTLLKALLNETQENGVKVHGEWVIPRREEIGYLDQHYSNLEKDKTVYELISGMVPEWKHEEVRRYLNDFLFRKNEEIHLKVEKLSGGEKVRLSLALIVLQNPKLLILDEVTNNLDRETYGHVVSVLKQYHGTLIVVSHHQPFLREIDIKDFFQLKDGEGKRQEYSS